MVNMILRSWRNTPATRRMGGKGSHLFAAHACVAAKRGNKHVTPIWAAEARP
jgi:hypothetical protein